MLLSQVGRWKTPHVRYSHKYLSLSALCFSPGMLKIHAGGSSSQQTVLTIPANQLKQLGVGTASGGLQTILMPVGKGNAKDNTCFIV